MRFWTSGKDSGKEFRATRCQDCILFWYADENRTNNSLALLEITPLQGKPLRILVSVILHYVDGGGGSPRLAYDEALHLRDQGHDVWMLAPTLNDSAPEYECRDGIHYLRYRHERKHAFDPRRLFWYKEAIVNLLKKHAPEKFDILHGHAALQHITACNFLGQNSRKCFSVHSPIVDELRAFARGMGPSASVRQFIARPVVKRIEHDCLSTAQWVNAFSNFTVKMIRHHHGDLADSMHIVPGWTDLNRFRVLDNREAVKIQLGWRTDVPVLFTLRRLVARMGLDRLVSAVSIMAKKGIDLQMVVGGAGPLRESLEILARDLNVAKKIKFLGFVPDDVLPLMYGACDAFVLPTAELECFGIIAVEALASGRPVLATPVAAIPEIVNCVEPRWLAESPSAEHISNLLTDFLSGKLPNHDPLELRTLVENRWNGRRLLDVYCAGVLGTV